MPIHSRITYVWIWLFGGAKYQGRDEVEARGTDEQPLSEKPRRYDFEKLTVPGSSNLKAQHKVLCCWKVKHELRVTSYEFKSTSYEFKSTSYEFKFTSYEFKSTSWSLKARVTWLKARVGRLKAWAGRLKARVRRLKARINKITT